MRFVFFAVLMFSAAACKSDQLVREDREFVCRSVLALVMGRDISIISANMRSSKHVDVNYVRPDDGKRWDYRCKIDGNSATWASVREDGTIGRWRDDPRDSEITFELNVESVSVREQFVDGSETVRRFTRDDS